MDEFEKLLQAASGAAERYVRFKICSRADADDVLQEIFLAAYQKFPQLKNRESFRAWIISIARNKCSDYFRRKAAQLEIPVENLAETQISIGRRGVSVVETVRETLNRLGDKDKQILYLFWWKEMPQAEIAQLLNIPLGTVKSRLHTAKQNFKNIYPCRTDEPKGEDSMKKMPEYIPEYRIEASAEPPFAVRWEEMMGWFLVPKLGEKLSWGMYDIPSRKCSNVYDLKVTGKAKVHGIEGVELTARETPYAKPKEAIDWNFVVQLTDTHCRYLAALRNEGDVRNYITFLDGEEFLPNWGFGEDNCGNETNPVPKGDIRREGTAVTTVNKEFLLDVVGRYTVTIGGRSYDTICVMDIETYNSGVVSEQFLDQNGKTILWRRFNRDDWAIERYQKKWSEQLPDNDRLIVNGQVYVHWYDCITEYIL
ncbi:MAG: RNA polymerase sigma factor [Clostridia bacterium]|nr:RNA polymerase sigma factor [Clostridia bacterium]